MKYLVTVIALLIAQQSFGAGLVVESQAEANCPVNDKFAQVCVKNVGNTAAMLVGSSWNIGDKQHWVILNPNTEMVYRLSSKVVLKDAKFSASYRPYCATCTQVSKQELEYAWSDKPESDCKKLPTYAFKYLTVEGKTLLSLVKEPTSTLP